ncbi:MAG TPA: gamma-glutamylcyclotransferase [Myxococcota bacterium]|nr:gamma-glutamylcyclotransferase [Myxococcota bacterium]
MSDAFTLRREHLLPENAAAAAELFKRAGLVVTTPEFRAASLAATLERVGPGEDVWVFGYGSLMWNPAFRHAERVAGRVPGWHRRFCLWNTFGRGTPDKPGLMLALERGGSCAGVGFRVPAAEVRPELALLWNREMLSGSYLPRWVRLATPERTVDAVTFVANRAHERYAGRLPPERIAELLARAAGPLGASREYLEQTVAALERDGVRDGEMHALLRSVQALP